MGHMRDHECTALRTPPHGTVLQECPHGTALTPSSPIPTEDRRVGPIALCYSSTALLCPHPHPPGGKRGEDGTTNAHSTPWHSTPQHCTDTCTALTPLLPTQ